MTPLQITFIILLCTIIASLSGKTPFSIISAGIILALILTGVMKPAEALNDFINTNVIMFVTVFVIGAALTKTSLLDRAQKLVVRYKNNPRMLVLISSLVAGFLAYLTSATAATAIVIPLLMGIANEIGTSRSKILFPTMTVANITTAVTFPGQGASNMTWSDVMIRTGVSTPFSVWDFTIARIPILLISLAYMISIGCCLVPDVNSSQFSDNIQKKDTVSQLTPSKGEVAVILILGTIVCMLLESVISIKTCLTVSIGARLLVLCGVLSEREALGFIHQPTVLLFIDVLALSDTIRIIRAGDVVVDWMISLLGDAISPYVIMAMFFIIPFILTQVISNLATVTIFIPLVAAACVKIGVDPKAVVMGVLITNSTSILTPMAAPCRIMVMRPGGYSLKDYLKCETPLAVMITIICVFILPIMFLFY